MLAAIEAVGDAVTRAKVLQTMAEMQMLGIRLPKQVDDTLRDATKVMICICACCVICVYSC